MKLGGETMSIGSRIKEKRKHLRKNKRAYSRLLKQRKFKIENLENEYKLPLMSTTPTYS